MGRVVGATVRLVLLGAAVAALIVAVRTVVARASGQPASTGVRVGSFDSWPPVPSAPAHSRNGS